MKYIVFEPDLLTWQNIVENNPYATFYQTPTWARIICSTFPMWQNASIGIDFDDGNRAIIPLLKKPIIGKIHSYWYESTAPGSYGGPIFEKPPTQEHYQIIDAELQKYSNILIVSNPYDHWVPKGNYHYYETFIQTIKLDRNFEKIWRNYSKGRRHTINFAKKQGVTTYPVKFLEYYEEYYNIYKSQLSRWGKNATDYYPLKLFENLAIASKDIVGIRFWAAFLDEKMISGLIVFHHNNHLVTWHGATLDEYFKYRPVDILYSAVIEDACLNGYEIFDFGNSGGHQGVIEYKEHFGSEKIPLIISKRRNISGLLYRGIRHLKNAIGKCPED